MSDKDFQLDKIERVALELMYADFRELAHIELFRPSGLYYEMRRKITTLETRVEELEDKGSWYQKRCDWYAGRVKAADDALFLAIKNKEKVEDDERLGRGRIATLEARVKELEDEVTAYERAARSPFNKQRIEELEGELAGWQQRYADQIRDPKQRQAYLAQLEKRKQ